MNCPCAVGFLRFGVLFNDTTTGKKALSYAINKNHLNKNIPYPIQNIFIDFYIALTWNGVFYFNK
jgi:hypothetical protein